MTVDHDARRRQISLDQSPEPDRYDALRASRQCPLCNGRKDAALLACWNCYRSHNMRDGMEPATAAIIDAAADALNEADRKQWIDRTADALVAHCMADLMADLDPNACGTCGAQVNPHTGRCPWRCNADRAGAITPLPVREMRLIPVPTVPDAERWTDAERAQAARVLSHQLAEMLSTYGSRTTLEALQLAFEADMVPAADAIGAQSLARLYTATGRALLALADSIEPHELNPHCHT